MEGVALHLRIFRSSAGVGFVGPYDRHTWGSGLTFLC